MVKHMAACLLVMRVYSPLLASSLPSVIINQVQKMVEHFVTENASVSSVEKDGDLCICGTALCGLCRDDSTDNTHSSL